MSGLLNEEALLAAIEERLRRVVREELDARSGPEVMTVEQAAARRSYAETRRRARLRTATGGVCESCAWAPPSVGSGPAVLNIHHVVPSAAGGGGDAENLAVLCPNCHAIAHRITFVGRNGSRHIGPPTKVRLLEMLAAIRTDEYQFRETERAFLLTLDEARGIDP